MKEDEKQFLKAVYERVTCYKLTGKERIGLFGEPIRPCVRDVIKELGMNEKRALYLLDKWDSKGWYNWGVTIDLGWLEEKGKEIAKSL